LPLVLRKDGEVDAIGSPGTLLGALPSPILEDVEASLSVGDSLILYTDGMLDVRDRSGKDDPEWLADQLKHAAGRSADEIAEHLSKAAVARHGGEPRDDIAILVLHRRGGR
jgi:serine phosphatase RsbU (regulator of sigma subunit)